MIHAKRTAPALVLTLLTAGCARVWVSPRVISDEYRSAPVRAAEVAVVRSVPLDSIPGACERVAVLRASGQQDLTDEAEMVAKLREETGKLGGNVVVILTLEDASRGERVLDVLVGTGVDRDALALSLRCPAEAAEELARRAGEFPGVPGARASALRGHSGEPCSGSPPRREAVGQLSDPRTRIEPTCPQ